MTDDDKNAPDTSPDEGQTTDPEKFEDGAPGEPEDGVDPDSLPTEGPLSQTDGDKGPNS